jgi:hypothetical protein
MEKSDFSAGLPSSMRQTASTLMSSEYVHAPEHGKQADELQALRLAFGALRRIVRDEFPRDCTLAEVVYMWGRGTPAEVDAVRRLEREPELTPRVSDEITQPVDVEGR